jgi:hypothetical protein
MQWTREMSRPGSINGNRPKQCLSSPVLDIKCMSSVPIAVVTCGDGNRDGTDTVTTKLIDLISGAEMGYASPTPVQLKQGGNTTSNGVEEDPTKWYMGAPPKVEWPIMVGFADQSEQDPRPEVVCASNHVLNQKMGGRLLVNQLCQSHGLYALNGDDLFILCHYRGHAAPIKNANEKEKEMIVENENEEAVKRDENEEEVELAPLPRPQGLPLQFTRYTCGDLLCELYPAIAACCPDGTTATVIKERQLNAKRLFVMSTAEQRKNPNAKLDSLLLGPQDMHPVPPTSTSGGRMMPPTASTPMSTGGSGMNSHSASRQGGPSRVGGSSRLGVGSSAASVSRMASAHGSVSTLGSVGKYCCYTAAAVCWPPSYSCYFFRCLLNLCFLLHFYFVGSMGSMSNGGSKAAGIGHMIRGLMQPGSRGINSSRYDIPATNDGGNVVKLFSYLRENKRDRDTNLFSKRHEELRKMSTKPK